jgi:(1->4)-alpha-D-glucan 1-alpha-D-glucosylmutase
MTEEAFRVPETISEKVQELLAQRRIPRATYRLQFSAAFSFRQARDLVPYFDDLGISDLYASPLFKTCSEEGHGYDVCDHDEFNPILGSQKEFEDLCRALQPLGMGLILDVVPNHMGISKNNIWWMDVLENGSSSTFSCYFDIDFHPPKPELENKILLPILEDQYGKVLESGKFRLAFEEGSFFIYYYDHKLPVTPHTYPQILGYPLENLIGSLGKEDQALIELQSILTALSHLPPQTEADPDKLEERKREKEVIKRRIASLYQNNLEMRAAIDEAMQVINGTVGVPSSFDLLDDLLSSQIYRPAFWRVAADEINYRRFFDINHLAAIRMELPMVFEAAHQFLFRLLTEGKVRGIRVDHPDGLLNPTQYFTQLQENYIVQKIQALLLPAEGLPKKSIIEDPKGSVSEWLSEHRGQKETPPWPLYVIAEKILGKEETLPQDWSVYGTTGYEFLNLLNSLFVNSRNRQAFDRIYNNFIGNQIHFDNLVNSSKKMIMLISMASEIAALSHQLERLSEKSRSYRDFTLNSLTFAVREVIACLPVYRTYIMGPENVPPRDEGYITAAVDEAKRRNPRTAKAIFDFIRDTLLLHNLSNFPEEERPNLIQFAMKVQQVTGPVMAKGLEDTAFYIYNRLVSLNEVGGHPDRFGIATADFHRQNLERQQKWPHSFLSTSTHDTKRSEDIRARINVLSEIPGEWRAALSRWSRLNASQKTLVDGQPAPDRNEEYLFYQTLIGAWPTVGTDGHSPPSMEELVTFQRRIASYMEKATLEAKVHTSWVNRNEDYDAAVKNFVLRVLENTEKNRFLTDLRAFAHRVAYFGQFNSLSQVLLKLTLPGVPDIYQGNEIWDFSLVDPDNRRPVDYSLRQSLLAQLEDRIDQYDQDLTPLTQELLENSQDGRIKLYLTYKILNFRRAHPLLFSKGSYQPLEAQGTKREHVCAFTRTLDKKQILVVAPRLVVQLTEGKEQPPLGEEIWKDTWLSLPTEWQDQTYLNLFTGGGLPVAKKDNYCGLPLTAVFSKFPAALLECSV